MYEYGAQLSPVKKNSQVRVCGENLWGDIWAGAVSRCGCGVRCAGAGAVHVRVRFYPHVRVGFFCGLSPKYENQKQNLKYDFKIYRTTQQDSEMNEGLFE